MSGTISHKGWVLPDPAEYQHRLWDELGQMQRYGRLESGQEACERMVKDYARDLINAQVKQAMDPLMDRLKAEMREESRRKALARRKRR